MELAELYPTLTPEELRKAEYNFRRYLEIVSEIAQVQEAPSTRHAIGNHRLRGLMRVKICDVLSNSDVGSLADVR